jgi:hypothetical protein
VDVQEARYGKAGSQQSADHPQRDSEICARINEEMIFVDIIPQLDLELAVELTYAHC